MTLRVKMQITGAEGLKNLLKELPDALIKQDVGQEQRKAMQIVRDEARRRAPVDTGRLREFIEQKLWFDKTELVWRGRVGLRRIGRGRTIKKGTIKYDARYGRLVETGTKYMPAQPFLRPAFHQKAQTFLDVFASGLRRKVERQVQRLYSKK